MSLPERGALALETWLERAVKADPGVGVRTLAEAGGSAVPVVRDVLGLLERRGRVHRCGAGWCPGAAPVLDVVEVRVEAPPVDHALAEAEAYGRALDVLAEVKADELVAEAGADLPLSPAEEPVEAPGEEDDDGRWMLARCAAQRVEVLDDDDDGQEVEEEVVEVLDDDDDGQEVEEEVVEVLDVVEVVEDHQEAPVEVLDVVEAPVVLDVVEAPVELSPTASRGPSRSSRPCRRSAP